MSHIEIVNRFIRDGFFVVEAEHYNDDGSFWYSENYRWRSVEGNGPYMDDSSIWEVVVQIHQERRVAGFVGGRDVLPPGNPEGLGSLENQQTGGEALMIRFVDVVGDTVVL